MVLDKYLNKYLTPDELKAYEKWKIHRLSAFERVGIRGPNVRWHEPGELGLREGEMSVELPKGLTPPRVQLILSQSEIDKMNDWFDKGAAFEKSGRLEDALYAYDKAIMINLDYATAWCRRGNVLSKLARPDLNWSWSLFEDAIRAFRKAIRINPNFADAWNDMGVACARRGDYFRARLLCEEALKIDPDHALAAANRIRAIEQNNLREQFHKKWREEEIRHLQICDAYQESLRKSQGAGPK